MMKTRLLYLGIGLFLSLSSQATTYNCNTVQQILDALAAVSAGDEIVIASGTYTSSASINAAYYYSGANGTASNPITIRGASSSNRPHLKGTSISSRTVLRIEGDYWIVKDLEISTGQKGLVFDNSNYSKAIHCSIHTFGNEAVHVRDGSDYVTIDDCSIYDTGNVSPGFGEGVYIGTDKGSWSSYDPSVDHTTVKNCTIGPDIRAEAFDIKEGTSETIVEYNTVHGQGISGDNYADSFIDLKGTRTYVRYNTFNQNNEPIITKGIAVTDRSVDLSGYDHVVHNNTFNMDGSTGNVLEAYSGTSNVYAFDNNRNPSGDLYNNRVTESCPTWYGFCNGGGSNSLPTVSITSPSNGATFTAGANVVITATASDSDGSIAKVEFYNGSTKLSEDSSSPYSYTWSNVAAGSYNLSVKAIDNDNASKTAAVSITVNTSGGGGSSSDLSVAYECGDTNPNDNSIKPYVQIVNDGSSSVAYNTLKMRYWFTMEGSATPKFYCDYAALGKSYIAGSFVNTSGSNYYLEVSFASGAGSLSANDDSGNIKLRITKSDWSNHNETNDYSFDPSYTSYADFDKITLYQNGNLIWGDEPSGAARSRSAEIYADELLLSETLIYPNPTQDLLTIRPDQKYAGGQMKIMSLTGQEVYSEILPIDTDLRVDTQNLSRGFYLVVLSKDAHQHKLRILKQ
ncbi:Ig-like domain-containing protein [Reichenbachiella agarivorans]|uniref:Ig-like domain-containing protein n=1 Tax=Reichenbachiella agarivorans TaxID=2979464 RepID=A0ABY6CQG8_9BACT|nr:Ig-like domain-containing protein [Reichenbachiella agarivorans]UXP32767.1 Ig-like domain-containing protein [Reichenbachiella agarivorans]